MPANLKLLIRARYPLIWLHTPEEDRAVAFICEAARLLGDPCTGWSQILGLHDLPVPLKRGSQADPVAALAFMRDQKRHVWVLKDMGALCHGPMAAEVIRALRETAKVAKTLGSVIVCVGHGFDVPPTLAGEVAVHTLALPDRAEHIRQLRKISQELGRQLDDTTIDNLAGACLGLTLEQAENIWAQVHASGGTFKKEDVQQVIAEKARLVRGSSVLEFVQAARMEDVGGLGTLKLWFQRRSLGFTPRARELGLPWPRGVLLVGVQGCGKSLAAKALAGVWQQPLLRLDVGSLMGSLVGQSEGNLRQALAVAERTSPCVLWLDELEKAFGGTKDALDGGVGLRILGTFLTWMQERTEPVFVIATSNDISALPPELLRKGRFDETFFVDLPTPAERMDIWKVHLGTRARAGKDPTLFDRVQLEVLSELSAGYSGAEIAAAVVEAAFEALAEGIPLDGVLLTRALSASPPLSQQRSKEIEELRSWARGRARSAG